jgi:hypothetical protein
VLLNLVRNPFLLRNSSSNSNNIEDRLAELKGSRDRSMLAKVYLKKCDSCMLADKFNDDSDADKNDMSMSRECEAPKQGNATR